MDFATTASDAKKFVKEHRKELCERFASKTIYPAIVQPSAYFMAGSPGAGKTEYSKSFIKQLEERSPARKIVRIDADEIRDYIPHYDHTNAPAIQEQQHWG